MNAPLPRELHDDALDRALVQALQAGLPRVPRPYHAIAASLGLPADVVMARIRALLASKAIRRVGAVPNHYRLGWTANAMSVWDVDDANVDALGGRRRTRMRVALLSPSPPSAGMAVQPLRDGAWARR